MRNQVASENTGAWAVTEADHKLWDRTLFNHRIFGMRLVIRMAERSSELEFGVEVHKRVNGQSVPELRRIDADQFRILLDAERAGLASFTSEALSPHDENSIGGSLSAIAQELNLHDPESLAAKVLEAISGRKAVNGS